MCPTARGEVKGSKVSIDEMYEYRFRRLKQVGKNEDCSVKRRSRFLQ